MAASIEGYASATSVAPGETVDFHVRASAARFADFSMQIVRRGVSDEIRSTRDGTAFVAASQDDSALAASGCEWPAVESCRIVVPRDWTSGYYVAILSADGATASIPFFVRSATPGATSRILLKWSDATAQAYTGWGGRSFYSSPIAPRISYDRPYDDLDLFERYQLPFVRWAQTRGIALDVCSSLDLHRDPQLLAPYRLLVSLGHDEYWSLEMRQNVEAFAAAGGNVAFFSANTCYWQARFDLGQGRRVMICYKETEGHPPDPDRADADRVTVRWYEPPLGRPENTLTGVSYRNGAGWWIDPLVPSARYRGYTVARADHWVFAGSGLHDGDVFGNGTSVDDSILGYETDAAALVPGIAPPIASGADGTPSDFAVLATADLSDWAAHGQGGGATMGAFQHAAHVVTVGTVNFAGGLTADASSPVDTIALNILRGLSTPRAGVVSSPEVGFGGDAGVVPAGWTLDGAGTAATAALDDASRADQFRYLPGATLGLDVDGSAGDTWVGRPGFTFTRGTSYGVGAWVRASAAGATIRLQTTDSWSDVASVEHTGSGRWEFLFARASLERDDAAVPIRVKLQVAAGSAATFGGIVVTELRP